MRRRIRQPPSFRRLVLDHEISILLGEVAHPVEEDGLSDPAEPEEHLALLGSSQADPCQGDRGCRDDRLSSGELRWWRPGAGREGVVQGIHASSRLAELTASYQSYVAIAIDSGKNEPQCVAFARLQALTNSEFLGTRGWLVSLRLDECQTAESCRAVPFAAGGRR